MDRDSTLNLIRRAKQGDKSAFGRLVEIHHNRLHVLVSLRLGPKLRLKVDIDDVLQEIYLRAYRGLKGFTWHGDESFLQWSAAIAENVIRDLARHHLAAQKRNGVLRSPSQGGQPHGVVNVADVEDLLAMDASSPSRAARREERFKRLEIALGDLNKDQREAIILARIHGLPIKEVARRMDKSPEAVSMLILRGLRSLKKIFGSTDSLRLPPRTLRSRFPQGLNGNGKPLNGGSHPGSGDGGSRARNNGV